MPHIVQDGDSVLRECAQTVPLKDISSVKIQKVISDMKKAMDSQKDGVAIAAPQIGVPLRIFVVSDKIMKEADKEYKSIGRDLVFINPEITKLSRDKHEVEEGCLSVRWKYGKVSRSIKATVSGYNELGEKVVRGASGLLAQVFQHETDHLDGVLFIDKAFDVQDIPPEDLENGK
ncbi:MAG: peptide deformylase [Patescibacteria group bacterium]|nr:peptide deformylase [Patescibacteria group bacterium]